MDKQRPEISVNCNDCRFALLHISRDRSDNYRHSRSSTMEDESSISSKVEFADDSFQDLGTKNSVTATWQKHWNTLEPDQSFDGWNLNGFSCTCHVAQCCCDTSLDHGVPPGDQYRRFVFKRWSCFWCRSLVGWRCTMFLPLVYLWLWVSSLLCDSVVKHRRLLKVTTGMLT